MNVGFVSLGCNKNLVDTEIMVGLVKQNGINIVTDEAQADAIVINTCAFIEDAKTEAIDAILNAARYKEGGRLKKLIVTGCLAQRYKDEVLSELPEVDAVVGVGRFEDIVNVIKSDNRLFTDRQEAPYPEYAPRVLATPPYSAYVKIAEGCDNCCTYCAIPMIRGHFRSRKIEDIVSEVRKLAAEGVREINVVAQDTTRYGEDIYGESRLVPLLKELEKTDVHWIRVLYTYPERISDEFLSLVNESEKIASYFDIPIQHISDSVLKKMNRRSTKKQIYGLIDRIRKNVKNPTLRTSLIVGFPGETQSDFGELCDFVRFAEFDRLGVFKYSREEGTPAYKLPGQLNDDIKAMREGIIMEIQKEISARKMKAKTGNSFEVLKIGEIGREFVGRTAYDAPEIDGRVIFTSGRDVKDGEFVKVKIIGSKSYDLIGEMTDEYSE